MARQSLAMFGWSWIDVSVLGSKVFRHALMNSCDRVAYSRVYSILYITLFKYIVLDTWQKVHTTDYSTVASFLYSTV